MASASKVLVLGGNFAGLTAAISVKHALTSDVDVTVLSASDQFLFTPSLIWLPFGERSAEDITFKVGATFEEHGVNFVHAPATAIDIKAQLVTAGTSTYAYDYLVIATGYQNKSGAVPGLGDGGPAYTITTLKDAIRAGEGWRKFLNDPGDIVVGAAAGTGCFGAAYEYLFNLSYQLKKAGLKKSVNLTYVSAEPFAGHFGIGGLPHGETLLGLFLKKEKITALWNRTVAFVDQGVVGLADGQKIPCKYAMIVPPFVGQDVIATCEDLTDECANVRVRDTYQSLNYDNVYAVGAAAAVAVPWQTPTPVAIPKTGLPTEQQAHVAARNIASQIRGETVLEEKAFGDIPAVCVMDAGNNGVIILADKMLPPRKHGVLIPGPQAHLMKLGFEKYFLWKAKHGYVHLP